MKTYELLSDASKWTKGVMARNTHYEPVCTAEPEAVCWCMMGAVFRCYPEDQRAKVLGKLGDEIGSIPLFNDSHDYEAVVAVLRKLDV